MPRMKLRMMAPALVFFASAVLYISTYVSRTIVRLAAVFLLGAAVGLAVFEAIRRRSRDE